MSERRIETLKGFYEKYIKPFYQLAHSARNEGKLVAWVASTFPVEILQAMDIIPVWPENYASLCAARRVSVSLCQRAERSGFSKDTCSYARCVLGSLLGGENLPEGGIPRPDILVASTCACTTHLKWFQIVSRMCKKPLLLLDAPYNIVAADPEGDTCGLYERYVKHYASQLEHLVSLLEEHSGTTLSQKRLAESLKLSNRTSELWLRIQDCRRNIPAPMGAREAFSAVYFMLCVPGTEQAVDFYEKLSEELQRRVKRGIGVVEDERHRLIWDNLPLWFDLALFRYLESVGAVVVAETFSHVWTGILDPAKPYETLARKHLSNMANCVVEGRIDLIKDLVEKFKADGVILPTNWGCRMMTIGETIVKEKIEESTGVSSLILDVDSTDWRSYDERLVKAKLETFLRTLR